MSVNVGEGNYKKVSLAPSDNGPSKHFVKLEFKRNVFPGEEIKIFLLATIAHWLFPSNVPKVESIKKEGGKFLIYVEKIAHDARHERLQYLKSMIDSLQGGRDVINEFNKLNNEVLSDPRVVALQAKFLEAGIYFEIQGPNIIIGDDGIPKIIDFNRYFDQELLENYIAYHSDIQTVSDLYGLYSKLLDLYPNRQVPKDWPVES